MVEEGGEEVLVSRSGVRLERGLEVGGNGGEAVSEEGFLLLSL